MNLAGVAVVFRTFRFCCGASGGALGAGGRWARAGERAGVSFASAKLAARRDPDERRGGFFKAIPCYKNLCQNGLSSPVADEFALWAALSGAVGKHS